MSTRPEALLLDLGGVLVEVAGVAPFLAWSRHELDEPELWRRWLASPTVRRFERGHCEPGEFAAGVVAEFDLRVDETAFLAGFARWPERVFPGAFELLRPLAARYRLASLSNTNAIHHDTLRDLGLLDAFDVNFLSHEVGHVKPDAVFFEHALAELGLPPERVFFVDDNAVNVETARRLGLPARQVRGVGELGRALAEADLI